MPDPSEAEVFVLESGTGRALPSCRISFRRGGREFRNTAVRARDPGTPFPMPLRVSLAGGARDGPLELRVTAKGYAERRLPLPPAPAGGSLRVVAWMDSAS